MANLQQHIISRQQTFHQDYEEEKEDLIKVLQTISLNQLINKLKPQHSFPPLYPQRAGDVIRDTFTERDSLEGSQGIERIFFEEEQEGEDEANAANGVVYVNVEDLRDYV